MLKHKNKISFLRNFAFTSCLVFKFLYIIIFIPSLVSKAEDTMAVITPDSIKKLVVQDEKADTNKSTTPEQNSKTEPKNPITNTQLPIKPSDNLNDKETQAPAVTQPDQDNKAEVTKPEVTKAETTKKDETFIFPEWPDTIMFDKGVVKSVRMAIKEFEDKKNKQQERTKIRNNSSSIDSLLDITDKPTISPTFYLTSIIYHTPKLWSFTLNKVKIDSSKIDELKHRIPELSLVSINASEIVLEWKTLFLNDLSPKWQEKLDVQDEEEYSSNDKNILLNKDRKTVIFKLKVNQTFDVYNMEISEGFVNEKLLKDDNISNKIFSSQSVE